MLSTIEKTDLYESAPKFGYVECLDEPHNDGTIHPADLAYVNDLGETVYYVPCDGYTERYTLDALIKPEDMNDLMLAKVIS